MGMVLGLVALDDDSITKVLADPPLISKLLCSKGPSVYEALGRGKGDSWFSRFFGTKEPPAPASAEPIEVARPVEDCYLDKAWHGIHYMLTTSAWEGDPPLNFLVLGGATVGDIDIGYGPARAFNSAAVRDINSALAGITEGTLRERFDPADMMKLGIYPAIWSRDPADDDTFGYCAEYFQELKVFVERTAERDLGIIVYLT